MNIQQSHGTRCYQGVAPFLADNAYVDPAAIVIGDVSLGKDCSVWPQVVIRGDVNRIEIGERSNIQDGSVIHVSRPSTANPDGYPTIIGREVTVGHKVMLHGCTLGNQVLIGMGAILLDGVIVEDNVVVGAGALVTPGKRLESGYLYTGSPARQIRPLKEGELQQFVMSAQNYVDLKNNYLDATR